MRPTGSAGISGKADYSVLSYIALAQGSQFFQMKIAAPPSLAMIYNHEVSWTGQRTKGIVGLLPAVEDSPGSNGLNRFILAGNVQTCMKMVIPGLSKGGCDSTQIRRTALD